MSVAPIELSFLEKKWAGGYSGSNRLIEAATGNTDRRTVSRLDNDAHLNVSSMGRRTLMSVGRFLYSNNPIVSGTIDEEVTYAVGTFIPQFYGEDKLGWGLAAENWIYEHDKICDVAGSPYCMDLYRRLLISSVLVDGDMGTALIKSESGYPFLQTIPAHRIYNPTSTDKVQGGPLDGARIIDGVIVNVYGAAIGYRVVDENKEDFIDISSRDMFLSFIPKYTGQVRGLSALGESAFDFQDVFESRRFEMIAQKMAASETFMVHNLDGDADDAQAFVAGTNLTRGSNAAIASGFTSERVDGVVKRYAIAGSQQKMDPVTFDRPSGNQQAFQSELIRGALHSIGWSKDFSLDTSKVGGASMRVVVEKINRQIGKLRQLIALPAALRFDGYRLSCAIQIKDLEPNKDWYKWTYQGGANITADAKYQSDVDVQEIRHGIKSPNKAAAERGDFLEDIEKELEEAADRKLTICKRLSVKHGITIQEAINIYAPPLPNGIQSPPPAAAPSFD